VTDVPDYLTLRRHRDLEGRGPHTRWIPRLFLSLVAAVCIAGLANVFGQRPATAVADTPSAKLSVYAPATVRTGDLVEARFHILAKRDLEKATLKLSPGWAEGISLNTIEPSPLGEASDNGRLSFTLGHIPAGQSFILFVQFQVNPTNIAWHRRQDVELDDGDQVVAVIHRSFTVFP
jgi:hypothetical protein